MENIPFLPSTPTRCDVVNCLWVFDVIVVAWPKHYGRSSNHHEKYHAGLHIKLTIYTSTDLYLFSHAESVLWSLPSIQFVLPTRRETTSTLDLMNAYLNHPSNVCHLAKLNESVPSIPNFQTFWKLLWIAIHVSLFTIPNTTGSDLAFRFPLSEELSTDTCPFFMSEVSRFMTVGQDGNTGKFMGDVGKCRTFVEETTWELWMDLLLSHPKSWQRFSWGGKTDWKCEKGSLIQIWDAVPVLHRVNKKVRFWSTGGTMGYPFPRFPHRVWS